MKKGDFVTIDYTGKIKENGKIFDTTHEDIAKKEDIYNPQSTYKPALVILGHNKIVKGLDKELLKMKVGDKKKIEVEPEEGFGKREPKLMKLLPASEFKKRNVDPYPGMVLDLDGMKCRVLSVNSGRVRVDFNHPLAGKNLIYDAEIKKKLEKNDEKIRGMCEYYTIEPEEINIENKKVEIVSNKEISDKVKNIIKDDIFDHMDIKEVKFSRIFKKKK